MFTKKDLKTGDVIVRRMGNVEIVLLDLNMLLTEHGWNNLKDLKDDLTDCDSGCFDTDCEWDIVKVYRPVKPWQCAFSKDSYEKGDLVYNRERDTKRYNAKVVCVDSGLCPKDLTVGKIYIFVNGNCNNDDGGWILSNPAKDLDDLNSRAHFKFIEIVE